MTQLAVIDRFLSGKRFALVGVSAHPEDFSRVVFRELTQRGYEVVAVNPRLQSLDSQPGQAGQKVYARVVDIPGTLDGAILMTPPHVTREVVRDCAWAHVPRVWMHRGAGRGAVDEDAVRFCELQQIEVIAGECPLMFVTQSGPHAAHAALKRAFGTYPQLSDDHPPLAPILAQAVSAWAVSTAALVLLLMAVPTAAFWLHALVAPIAFGAAAAAYFGRADAAAPMHVAALNVALAGLLDLAVVAGIVMRSWALYTSFAGALLPLMLIFAATLIVGTHQVANYSRVRRAPA